ncbi:MAG TPA: hypothetical protein VH969_07595 [Actinophytocola sp.]|jgi:hypothetical protein|uniref:hypothetical protein n=1 Tax=Actinophytocola sp. TaxID=1872138 RepID=UPI002F938FF8
MTFAGYDQVTGTVALVAQPTDKDPAPTEDTGKSSPTGLFVVLLLLVAVVLLVRSMTKHLKRVPASFDDDEPEDKETAPPTNGEDPADSDGGTAKN